MKYQILQIKNPRDCDYSFMSWNYAQPRFNFEDYQVVYEGETTPNDPMVVLEGLFEVFNISRPNGFKGRSMSVSDIVKLKDDYYYVDDIGFRQINIK